MSGGQNFTVFPRRIELLWTFSVVGTVAPQQEQQRQGRRKSWMDIIVLGEEMGLGRNGGKHQVCGRLD